MKKTNGKILLAKFDFCAANDFTAAIATKVEKENHLFLEMLKMAKDGFMH